MTDEKTIEDQFNVLFDDITEDLEKTQKESAEFTGDLSAEAKDLNSEAKELGSEVKDFAEVKKAEAESAFEEITEKAEAVVEKGSDAIGDLADDITDAVNEKGTPVKEDPEEFFEELSLEDDKKAEERYSMDLSEEDENPYTPSSKEESYKEVSREEAKKVVKDEEEDEMRRKENRRFWIFTAIIALLVAAVILAILYFRGFIFRKEEAPSTSPVESVDDTSEEDTTESDPTDESDTSSEEEKAEEQAVLEKYEKLFVINDKAESDTVLVRDSASKEGRKIGIINKFAGGEIIDKEGDWYHIKSGGLEGYVYADFVAVEDEAKELAVKNAKKYVKAKVENTLNIRTTPSTDGEVIGTVLNGGVMEYSGEEEGFYRVSFADRYEGYVSKDFSEYDYFLQEAVPYVEE